MFEITLTYSARANKTFLAAQYLQRTLSNLSLESLSLTSRFSQAESGAKVRQVFYSTKFFRRFFKKTFLLRTFHLLQTSSLIQSGCKGKLCFLILQIFFKKTRKKTSKTFVLTLLHACEVAPRAATAYLYLYIMYKEDAHQGRARHIY